MYLEVGRRLSSCPFIKETVRTTKRLYKGKGPKDKASSYRPINLCSTIGKTLELIVKNQLLTLVNEHSAMNSAQHEFTNNRSTITNLLATERHLTGCK